MKKKLSTKEKQFCQNLLKGMSNAEAYMNAGYSPGSNTSAATSANRLIKKSHIQEYIKEERKKIEENTGLKTERLISELEALALGRITDFAYFEDGNLFVLDSSKWPESSGLISRIVTHNDPNKKISKADDKGSYIEFSSKTKIESLKLLCKITGLLDDQNVAFAVLRKYGYEIIRVDNGILLKDPYLEDVQE